MDRASERRHWVGPTLLAVGLLTGLRLLALAFNRTDLFVDESQYWLWGQRLDFGYYSKPPLIGWLIRAVTGLAGSDAPFWVRMPGALLHGATAMILAAAAARTAGARAAFWTGLSYATLPFVAVGSLILSTDTVMAPAYAAALYGWLRMVDAPASRGWAVWTGAAIGLAALAKYAAVYFLIGAGLAALFTREGRIGRGRGALLLLAFGAVMAPNVVWNLTHDLATVNHTMDNVGWVRQKSFLSGLNPGSLAGFMLNQFAVFGPVLFAGLLAAMVPALRAGGRARALALFALPPLIVVSVQALLEKAYANWALAAYFAGTLIAVPFLLDRAPRALRLSVLLNGLIAVTLPVLTILAPWPARDGAPLLKRYLGRAELSRQIIATAKAQQVGAVYATSRDILADLFYTGAGAGLAFYAPRPAGRPHNYYEQTWPLPDAAGPALAVLSTAPVCGGRALAPVATFDTTGTAHARDTIAAYLLPGDCR